ncbi:carbohydrate ABC transporter permease [Paenibacillus gansuensis]|uniref:Carbohydrate ABC transporter permease n=1 Tax=Paenibacillus gansuensis TaxID=306542 RepID=A0ABW5P8Q2_9BACL
MAYKSASYRIFTCINTVIMAVLALSSIIPIIHILAVSLSNKSAADANLVGLLPINITFEAYKLTLGNPNFVDSLLNSFSRTVVGTGLSIMITVMIAFALSKEKQEFRGRNAWAWFFVFTMLFNGGLIPTYIMIQKLHLLNTFWVMVLPGAVNIFNMILLLNFFRTSVPKSLSEAAYIDGGGHFQCLIHVYLPISMPALATISLFTLVGYWNEWFSGLVFLNNADLYPLSTLLQTIIVQQDFSRMNVDPSVVAAISNRTVKASQIFIAMIPVILVYPFLQRFFVKGMVLGSVKE